MNALIQTKAKKRKYSIIIGNTCDRFVPSGCKEPLDQIEEVIRMHDPVASACLVRDNLVAQ